MVTAFEAMADTFQISHDRFIRTTDADHYAASQELWRRIAANGDLYLDCYEGWYSVRDEAYYDESELIDATDAEGAAVRLSPQGTPVVWTVEESWFFRLSKYQQQLLDLYDDPSRVRPASRVNEMRSFVAGGLRDLSVSRTSFDWGVPVPDVIGHVMYVWLDALTNYLTGAGFPGGEGEWWPADLHIVGKDVVRFHAVYWPAFLMSAGLPVAKTVFGHGFVLDRGLKMSKSVGNVVDPLALAQTLGVDRLRWFLLRDVAFGEDGNYSHEAIVERTNADLANGIGNLAQRALSMVAKDGGTMPAIAGPEDDMRAAFVEGTEAYFAAMHGLQLHRALEAVMGLVTAANGYFADAAPWALKDDPARRAHVLAVTLDATRRIAILAQPAIPGCGRAAARPARRRCRRARFRVVPGGRAGGDAAAAAAGCVPALDRARLMLVDSHCHLNYKGLVEDQAGVIARARAAGVGTMLGISTRVSEWDEVIALADRESDIWATVGVHPHEADQHPDTDAGRLIDAAAAPARHRHRRDRPRLLLRQERPGAATGELSRPYRGGARHRAAVDRPHPRCRGRYRGDPARGDGAGRLRRCHPLLYRESGLCRAGTCAWILHLDLRNRDVQERAGSAG